MARMNFQEGLEKLQIYQKTTNNRTAPENTIIDGFPLGKWEKAIRSRQFELSAEKRLKLEEHNFVFDLQEYQFQQMCQLLLRYQETYGTLDVKNNVEFEGKKLGNWVSYIRSRKRSGLLSQDRIQVLDELGFIWSTRDYRFHENARQFAEHRPTSYSDKTDPNVQWILNTRRLRNLSYSQVQTIRLYQIPMDWEAFFGIDKKNLIEVHYE